MKNFAALFLLTFAFCQTGRAAGYSTSFDSGYNTSQQLAGQNGWVIDDATPNLSFLVIMNASIAGAIGGYHDVPAGPSARVSHPLSLPFAESSLNVDVNVQPSTAGFPGRDAFGVSAYNPGGANLITIQFDPNTTQLDRLNIHWFTGGGSPVVTGMAILYDGPYHVGVNFAGAGADVNFTATVSSGINSFSFNGTLPGLAGATWASVGSDFFVRGGTAGDNFMVFDNVAAVPEPAMTVLFSLLAAVGLLRRRR